jgi:peptidoglycan/xylan/chitin deacetylase (PgdA/CDA1 family)
MRVVSPFLRKVVYPGLAATGFFRRLAPGGLAVATYHGVLPPGYEPIDSGLDGNLVTSQSLRQQLRLLKAKYHVISPQDFRRWLQNGRELPRRAVLLSCDDGLLNNLTDMLPILREEGVSCLFFVTGASAGESRESLWYEELLMLFLRAPAGQFEISCESISLGGELGAREQRRAVWWNAVKRLSQVDQTIRKSFLRAVQLYFGMEAWQPSADANSAACRRFGLMTAAELRTLGAAGMTIGAHTMSHPMLSQATSDLARREISESRERLEAVLGEPPWAFAYPFGDLQSVTPEVLRVPKEAGFEAAFLNCAGGLGSDLPFFAMPRIHVTADMSLPEFEGHIAGFYSWLQRRAGRTAFPRADSAGP